MEIKAWMADMHQPQYDPLTQPDYATSLVDNR